MKNLIKLSYVLVLLLFVGQDIMAQASLSIQGIIRLSDGNAVDDGEYEITFKLYDSIVGGNLLWTEVQPNVQVTSGIYSAILGEVTALDLPFDETYYLSLTFNGEELLPRAPFTSAPYAVAVRGSDNVFPSTGNVGVGLTNPAHPLDVDGVIHSTDDIIADSSMIAQNGDVISQNGDIVAQSGNIVSQNGDIVAQSGDIRGDGIITKYGGSHIVTNLMTAATPLQLTIPMNNPVPALTGVENSIAIVVPSDVCQVNVLTARVINTTTIEIWYENPGGGTLCRFNYMVFGF